VKTLVAGARWSSLARTQGAPISIDMGATEDTARGRAARSGGTDFLRQTLLAPAPLATSVQLGQTSTA